MPDAPDQGEYWSSNLDAQNLGKGSGNTAAAADALARELRFYPQPDQQAMFDHLEPTPGNTIVDLGCGLGIQTALLSRTGATVLAVDLSHDRLVEMRRQLSAVSGLRGKIYLVKARAEALPFRESTVDGLLTKAVLIHTELPVATTECVRVLKRGGRVAYSEPMSGNPLANLYRRTLAPPVWREIARYFGPTELALATRGLRQIRVKHFYLTSFAAFAWQYAVRSPAMLRLALRIFGALDHALVRVSPRLRDRAWFAVILGTKY